jgi:photosystem II stability/assembly factor-like uncharacterized protein
MSSSRFLSVLGALALGVGLGCHDVHFEPHDYQGEIDIFDDLFAAAVPDANHVVAVGYWGAIYVSEDGGRSWKKSDSGTERLLYDVSMANDKAGWAVGQLGLILRTEDGGRTWSEQENPKKAEGKNLLSVVALDADRAWITGDWGTRIFTKDGGRTWEDHSLTIDQTHSQFVWLSIPDQERVRNGEKVFEDVSLTDVSCLPADKNRCWIIGEFAYIFRTETGGIAPDGSPSWEKGQIVGGLELPPLVMGYNVIELTEDQREQVRKFAEEIKDQEHLNVAIEPRLTAAEISTFGRPEDPTPLFEIVEARTQEIQAVIEETGILSDRIRRRGPPPWDYEDFIDDDPEFLERYYDTRNADFAGVEVAISQNPFLFTVRFADPLNGLISGLGGIVLRSTDGGRTWNYQDVGRKQAIFAVQPLPSRAIAVGEKGLMRVSDDGGLSWHEQRGFPTIFTFMRDIQFDPDGRVGYIVGQRGKVLRSEDSGQSWRQVLPPSGADQVAGVEADGDDEG